MKKKTIFIACLTLAFMTILGLSYGTFIVNTDKYNASELLVSNLLYGIDIKNVDGSKIDGKTVTTNEIKTILATITSLNPVDSNYSLEYKITSGTGKVYYSETTGWKPSGTISKDNGIIYVKTIKVVLVPNTTMTVEFNVNGGYSYNSELLAMTGYNKITEEYKDTSGSDNEEPLVDVVKKDNNCVDTPCLYGGESKNNYLQYPASSNTTDNIWRITGNINNGIKVVSNITGTTTQNNITSSLNTFYGSLTNTEEYILKTNNFNCTDTGCTGSSKFNNIGLISTYEYNKVGGSRSYLANSNNFFSVNNDNIENITPSGIEQTTTSTSSGLRPTVYLSEDVNVTGSGTASDPYRIYSVGKVITVKYTKNGTPVSELPSKEEYIVNSVTCTGGRVGRWDEATNTVILTKGNAPTTCTVDFKAGYTVTMKSNDATIETPSSKVVGRIGETSFTFSTTNAYDLSKASVSCVGGANGSVSGSTVNITNVMATNTCTLTIPKKTYAINVSSNDTSMGTVSIDKTSVEYGGNATITISPKTGYEYASDNCGGTRSGNTITLSNITSTQSCTVTFKTSYSTLADTLKKAYPSSGARTDFSDIYTETSLHTAPDNFGTSYYFTGNPNNWVNFAGYLWRVIRINGDSSIRLLYAGSGKNDAYISVQSFNNNNNSPACVGWKYSIGGSVSADRENGLESPAYKTVKNWYNNLNEVDKSYISQTAIYCSDRNLKSGETYSTTSMFRYASYDRVKNKYSPSLICGDSKDSFNLFGLITGDEIIFAGGRYELNSSGGWGNNKAYYYLNASNGRATESNDWWTMTPSHGDSNAYGSVMVVKYDGALRSQWVHTNASIAIRPVISLKSCVEVKDGAGTGESPYNLTINTSCSTLLN